MTAPAALDYVAKLALACPVSATKTWRDAVAALEAARDRASELLERSLLEDCIDARPARSRR